MSDEGNVNELVSPKPLVSEPKNYGRRGHLTPEQQEIADEFIEKCDKEALELARFTKEDPRDTACRYLRGRKFVLEAALQLLRDCKDMKVSQKAKKYAAMSPDEAGDVDVDIMKTFYPHAMQGHDRENRPILWDLTGKMNANALTAMFTRENLLGYHYWTMEKLLDERFTECSKLPVVAESAKSAMTPPDLPHVESCSNGGGDSAETTSEVEGEMFADAGGESEFSPNSISTLAVLDLEGFGLGHLGQNTMEQIKLYISTDNVCYPETLGKMVIINAPWLINKVWHMIQGWLDERTVAKIEIIGDSDAGIKRLHELVQKDQLPVKYGGTAKELVVPKPHCEYQLLPRGGVYCYEITVPSNCSIIIDTYVRDVTIEYTVESRCHPNATELANEKARKETVNSQNSGWFSKKEDMHAQISYNTLSYMKTKYHFTKHNLEPDSITNKIRHINKLTSKELNDGMCGGDATLPVQVNITWKNTAKMTRYAIVFGITLVEED